MAAKSKKKNNKKKGEKKKLQKTLDKSKKKKKISKNSLSTNTTLTNMTIGNFGKTITFMVNSSKIQTFSDFNRTVTGRWETHGAIGKKEKTEFIGPGLASETMTIVLDAGLGASPRKMIEKIEKAVKKGTVEYLVIGGKKVGSNKMKITEVSEEWETLYSNGFLYRATLNVTFEEYVK